MVFRRRAARKPRRKVRKAGRKARVPRGIGTLFNTTQMASVKETLQITPNLNGNAAYAFQFTLGQFERASNIARNFKWYKAVRVEWSIEPLFNVFTDDGTPQSIPYLYMLMNRTQDNTGNTLQDLQECGCKPQKLTSKKVFRYVPNWCSPGLLSYSTSTVGTTGGEAYVSNVYQNGLKPQYAWLKSPGTVTTPTSLPSSSFVNPAENQIGTMASITDNQVVYNGHTIFLDQALSGDVPVARVTVTVHWEFKDPQCIYATAPPAKAIQLLSASSASSA